MTDAQVVALVAAIRGWSLRQAVQNLQEAKDLLKPGTVSVSVGKTTIPDAKTGPMPWGATFMPVQQPVGDADVTERLDRIRSVGL